MLSFDEQINQIGLERALCILHQKKNEVARFQADGLTDKALDILIHATEYLEAQLHDPFKYDYDYGYDPEQIL